jgi:hypothetical protein
VGVRDTTGRLSPPLDLTGFVDLACHDDVQLFRPAVDASGEPRLQPGESVVAEFDTIGAGIRSGRSPVRHVGGSMEDMDGRCLLTTTRLVFVCHRWRLGGDLRSARRSVESPTDHPAAAGTRRGGLLDLGPRLLVGQVRWPWLAELAYSQPSGRHDGLVELRCVQPDRQRETSIFLSLVPARHADVDATVRSIVGAVRHDRLGHRGLGPERASELRALEVPAAGAPWTTVRLPGAYKRMASTAANGGQSAVALAPWRDQLVDHIRR